jgi:hypothetical protein
VLFQSADGLDEFIDDKASVTVSEVAFSSFKVCLQIRWGKKQSGG